MVSLQDSSLGTPYSSPGSALSFGDSFNSRRSSTLQGRERDDCDSESESDFSAKVSGFDDKGSTLDNESVVESSTVAGSSAQNVSSGEYETETTLDDSSTDEDSEDEDEDGDTLSGIQSDSQSTLESSERGTQSTISASTIVGMKQPAAFLTQIMSDFSRKMSTGANFKNLTGTGFRQSLGSLDSESSGVLHAVSSGDMSLLKEELKGETGRSVTDSNHRTLLHVACSLGRLEMVKLFIEMGMNVDACSMIGQTPLHEACIGGHYSVLKMLLSQVSDLDAVDTNGLSAAHYCALNGEVKCLDLLCEQVSCPPPPPPSPGSKFTCCMSACADTSTCIAFST